jgi:hypothetical protein
MDNPNKIIIITKIIIIIIIVTRLVIITEIDKKIHLINDLKIINFFRGKIL